MITDRIGLYSALLALLIVLVILNRHRASRSSDFEITRAITAPLGSVNKICIVSLQLSEFTPSILDLFMFH